MTAAVVFQFPAAWLAALPIFLLLAVAGGRQRRRGFSWGRIAALGALRAGPFLVLLFLVARPVRMSQAPASTAARPVMVLVDRSESMSLNEQGQTRYQRAVDFLSRRLAPALRKANLPLQAMLFAQDSEPAGGAQIAAAKPDGKRTNLGGAIARSLSGPGTRPLAVIALTDGIANEGLDNRRAVKALTEEQVPFIGVGFGEDKGVETLGLRRVQAPACVAPRTVFNLSAELQLINAQEPAAFDLVLFRDGQFLQKKSITPRPGSRTWLENFQLSDQAEGVHRYEVQLLPPNQPNLKCAATSGSASVKVVDEQELRVLYIQGALTWDYKFIGLALRSDPALKLTGLTRTSSQSVFRQNVESAGELLHGFPSSLQELAPFRVVVLSNLRPADLSAAQQELLARFCGELGGGVLMMGGAGTFDRSWQNSRLEQLLPVVFSAVSGAGNADQPFQVQLTDAAVLDPVFQLAEDRPPRQIWAHLPSFSQYGKVDQAKLGAQVWLVHPTDQGPQGHRILMASQRYGAGLSAVLCLQNFWRWRLAKDAKPEQFDRFWRQLFRWLGEAGRQEVTIQLAGQELRPHADIEAVLERQASPQSVLQSNRQFVVQVANGHNDLVHQEALELAPFRQVQFRFRAEQPGRYTLRIMDSSRSVIAERQLDLEDADLELEQTARDMETLRQWAGVTDGLAFKLEQCPKAADLVAQIQSKVEHVRHEQQTQRAVGVNGWVLSLVLGCLCGEWVLRRKWGLL